MGRSCRSEVLDGVYRGDIYFCSQDGHVILRQRSPFGTLLVADAAIVAQPALTFPLSLSPLGPHVTRRRPTEA